MILNLVVEARIEDTSSLVNEDCKMRSAMVILSTHCSSQKILGIRKNKVLEQRLWHMCIRASLPRVSVNVPHAEHLVNLLMKSQLPRLITRGVGLLELFPCSFWGEEQFGTVLVL